MKREILICVLLIVYVASVDASSYKIEESVDKLDINEALDDVKNTIGETELAELKSYNIQTEGGTTKANQYIKFGGVSNVPYVRLEKSDSDVIGDYLFVDKGTTADNAFFEYSLEFEEGLSSELKNEALEDIDNAKITFFGDEYIIASATVKGAKFTLTLLGQGVIDLIEESTTKSFTVAGEKVDVKVISVDKNDGSAKLEVNGQETSKLKKSETYILNNDIVVGVSDILISSGQTSDIVKTFVGKKMLKFKDENYKDDSFEQEVTVNKDKLSHSYVKIKGVESGTTVKISEIAYRVTAENKIYIANGETLKVRLTGESGLLGNLDLKYSGLSSPGMNDIHFLPSGSNEYKLIFKNKDGNSFNVPFISNKASFKLGDDDQDLIITEGSSSSFNVDKNDYFVVTTSNTKTGSTYVLKYNSIDTITNTVTFELLGGGGTQNAQYTASTTPGGLGEVTGTVGDASFLV